MRFITTKNESSLADLAHQLFDVKTSKSAAAKNAQTILRATNPHFNDHAKIPAETLVVIPDAPGAKTSASQSLTDVSPTIVAQLQQALTDAQSALEQSSVVATREIETSALLAKSRDLIALAKQTPEISPLLGQITEQSKLQIKQIQLAKTDQLQGLAQLQKDLSTLS